MRRRQILEQSLGHIANQLELVRRRRDEIAKLEAELLARRKRVNSLLRESKGTAGAGRGGDPSQNTQARP